MTVRLQFLKIGRVFFYGKNIMNFSLFFIAQKAEKSLSVVSRFVDSVADDDQRLSFYLPEKMNQFQGNGGFPFARLF